jgi:hypothetical protein
MVKYCKYCGATNEDDAQFCESCGEELKNVQKQRIKKTKNLKDILSESADIIMGNQKIIVVYLAPVIPVLIWLLVMWEANFFPYSVLEFLSFVSVFGILSWIFSVVAAAFAIEITYNVIRGERITLSEAWSSIGIKKILMLLVASLIVAILAAIGLHIYWVVTLVVLIPPIFVEQCILVDHLSLGAAFQNSYNMAKDNLLDVFVLVLIFFVLDTLLSLVPLVGSILEIFLEMYFTVAFTIFYVDRK